MKLLLLLFLWFMAGKLRDKIDSKIQISTN